MSKSTNHPKNKHMITYLKVERTKRPEMLFLPTRKTKLEADGGYRFPEIANQRSSPLLLQWLK